LFKLPFTQKCIGLPGRDGLPGSKGSIGLPGLPGKEISGLKNK
jgi:hypothetical protein